MTQTPTTAQERRHILQALKDLGGAGVVISALVAAYAQQAKATPARARYVTRDVLDKGHMQTDKNFRLHLTPAGLSSLEPAA